MILHRRDVVKILEVMDQFPEAKMFELENSGPISGLGSITTLKVTTIINGLEGEFSVEISGVENW